MAYCPNFAKLVEIYGVYGHHDVESALEAVRAGPAQPMRFMVDARSWMPTVVDECNFVQCGEKFLVFTPDNKLVTIMDKWLDPPRSYAMENYYRGQYCNVGEISYVHHLNYMKSASLRGSGVTEMGWHHPVIYTGWWAADSQSTLRSRIENTPENGLYRAYNSREVWACSLDNLIMAVEWQDRAMLVGALRELELLQ